MESRVVCRQLNFTGANFTRGYYGGGSGTVLLDNIKCTGNELYIWECIHLGWNVYLPGCATHRYDVSVECY